MATEGKIMNFYSDKEQTTAVFPRTKVDAVSDSTGTGLGAILDGKLSKVLTSDCYGEELPESGVEGQLYFIPAPENETFETSILQIVYPIGSIYMSISNANPSDLFGFGTWERIQDTFLLAAGGTYAAGSTGGEATHTLTLDEMPKHGHEFGAYKDIATGTAYQTFTQQKWATGTFAKSGIPAEGSNAVGVHVTGGSQPHNNMPPYLSVYMWKRTA